MSQIGCLHIQESLFAYLEIRKMDSFVSFFFLWIIYIKQQNATILFFMLIPFFGFLNQTVSEGIDDLASGRREGEKTSAKPPP